MPTPPPGNDTPIYLSKDGNVSGPFNSAQIEEMKKNGEYKTFSWYWDAAAQNWAPITPPKPPGAPPAPNASNTVQTAGENTKSITRNISTGNTSTGITKTGLTVNLDSNSLGTQPGASHTSGAAAPSLPTSRPNSSNQTNTQSGVMQPSAGNTSSGVTNTGMRSPSSGHSSKHEVKHSGTQGHAPSIPGVPAICFSARTIIAGKLSELSSGGCVFRSDETTRSLPDFLKGTKVKLNILEESSGKSENLDAVIQRLTLFDGHWEFHLAWDRIPTVLEHLK